jgi:hypothetical protein
MALTSSSGKITYQRVASSHALNALLQSFFVLPSNPASLYLSNASQNLINYTSPTRVVKAVSLQYLVEGLVQGERIASAFESFLETGAVTLVFFDARGTAKILFESCDIRISNPVCFIHPSP